MIDLYETHSHTPLCRHAEGEPEAYAEVAARRGLTGIVVTCHNPMPDGWGAGVRMLETEFGQYLELVARAREAMRGRVDVRLGLECDYVPGMEGYLEKQIASAPLQYVLGSVHPHLSSYRKTYWKGNVRETQRLYFEHLALAAKTGLFDTIAHPDLIKMALAEAWDYELLRPDVLTCLDVIARTGMAMELNTSGLTKAPAEMNPGPRMLRDMRERGIPLVLGADAHKPGRVAADFDRALDAAEAAGYETVSYFLERKRHAVPVAAMRKQLRLPKPAALKAVLLLAVSAGALAGTSAQAVELATPGVIPVLAGPLQTLLALLPGLLVAAGGILITLLKPKTVWKVIRLLWRQKLPLTGVACVATLGVYGMGELWPAHTGTAAAQNTAVWMLYRGGPERRGWIPGADDPTQGGIVWAQQDLAASMYATPAVAGPYVYISTAAGITPFDQQGQGRIGCFDARSGALVWQDGCRDLRAVFSSPSVSEKYVVCGEGLHMVKDARVVCLERETGRRVWEFRTGQHVESTPCIHKDRVFVGAGDDGYYALALEGDGQGGPKVLWHKTRAEGFEDCETSPVAHEDRVYVGLGNQGQAIVCLDAATGAEHWRLKTPFPVFSPPSIANGKLFVGMGFGDFIKSAEDLNKPVEGEVWCVELARPEKPAWTVKTSSTVLGAVAVANEQAYFAARDGWCYAVNVADGVIADRWNAQAQIMACPAVTERHVYFVTRNGMLYGLDRQTFRPVWDAVLWTSPPKAGQDFFSSPTVAHGHVYVGSAADGLLCVGEPGQAPEEIWAGFQGGAGKSGRIDRSPLSKQYELAWTFPEASDAQAGTLTGPAACHAGAFYLPWQTGTQHRLVRLNLNTQDASSVPAAGWSVAAAGAIAHAPVVKGNAVCFVEGQGAQTLLRAVDRETGRELWKIQGQTAGELQLAGPRLLAAILERGLLCVQLAGPDAGQERWRYAEGHCIGAPAFSDGRVFVALADPPRLAVLDAETGVPLWTVALSAEATTGPVLAGETVCVGTKDGLQGFALLDGRARWKAAESGAACMPLAVLDEQVAQLSGDGKLSLVLAQDGSMVKAIPGVPGRLMPLLASEGLFYAARNGFARASLDASPAREVWFRLPNTLEKAVAAPLVVGGRVYVGTARGWACLKAREP